MIQIEIHNTQMQNDRMPKFQKYTIFRSVPAQSSDAAADDRPSRQAATIKVWPRCGQTCWRSRGRRSTRVAEMQLQKVRGKRRNIFYIIHETFYLTKRCHKLSSEIAIPWMQFVRPPDSAHLMDEWMDGWNGCLSFALANKNHCVSVSVFNELCTPKVKIL